MVNGVLYVTLPDHVWAIDARTGREIWHLAWPSTGGIHIGNRGVAISRRLALLRDARLPPRLAQHQGRHRAMAQEDLRSRSVLLRLGRAGHHQEHGDRRRERRRPRLPGYSQAHDLATGELQWSWYAVPQKKGEPGSETWPNEDAMKHGGGMTWQPVTYDPELNLHLRRRPAIRSR